MPDKKFSNINNVAPELSSNSFGEHPTEDDVFVKFTHQQVAELVTGYIKNLGNGADKLIKINPANDNLEGITFVGLLSGILTGVRELIFKNEDGHIIQQTIQEILISEILSGTRKLIFKNETGNIIQQTIKEILKSEILENQNTLIFRDAENNILQQTIKEILKSEILISDDTFIVRIGGDIIARNLPPLGYTVNYITGLKITIPIASDSIDVEIGACRDDSNILDMNLSSSINKTFTAFVEGDGNGALDVGSALDANSSYFVFAINKVKEFDILISKSSTSPSMPIDFVEKRIIGSFISDNLAEILPQTLYSHNVFEIYGINGLPYATNFISGIQNSYLTSTTLTISEMYARCETDVYNLKLFDDITINTALHTSGGNMLGDAVANKTQYYIYLCTKITGNDTNVFISNTLTPTLPIGYVYKRIIGAFKTELTSTDIWKDTITADIYGNGTFAMTNLKVFDIKAQGVPGGDALVGDFYNRDINIVKMNSIPGTIINTTAKQITLPKGTYNVEITQAISKIDATGRVYNVTDGEELFRFTSNDNGDQASNSILCFGKAVFDTEKVIEIQYYAKDNAGGVNSLGKPLNITGLEEIYLIALFTKIN